MNAYREIELSVPARQTEIPATLDLPEGTVLPPLVAFAHGFGGTRQEGGGYRKIAARLAESGIASIRMDFPGCGDSAESFRLCTLKNMVNDVQACIQTVSARYPIDQKRLGAVGMSLGGRVAMELVNACSPRFSAAVFIAPAAVNKPIHRLLGDDAAWERAHQHAKEAGFTAIPSYFGGEDLDLIPEWFEQIDRLPSLENASPGSADVRVVYAEDDQVVPARISKQCIQAYAAAHTEISGDGHSFGCYSDRTDILEQLTQCVVMHFIYAWRLQ